MKYLKTFESLKDKLENIDIVKKNFEYIKTDLDDICLDVTDDYFNARISFISNDKASLLIWKSDPDGSKLYNSFEWSPFEYSLVGDIVDRVKEYFRQSEYCDYWKTQVIVPNDRGKMYDLDSDVLDREDMIKSGYQLITAIQIVFKIRNI